MRRAISIVFGIALGATSVGVIVACNAISGISAFTVDNPPKDCYDCMHQNCNAQLTECLGNRQCGKRAACIEPCGDGNLDCINGCVDTFPVDNDDGGMNNVGRNVLECAAQQCGPHCLVASDAGANNETSQTDSSCQVNRVVTINSCAVDFGSTMGLYKLDSGVAYCVDQYEATAAEYAQFAAAAKSGCVPVPPQCNDPTHDFASSGATTGDKPVVGVDWCDAFAFCAWSGKRLCGMTPNGGPLPLDSVQQLPQDEWYGACSDHGANFWPYGQNIGPGNCNDLNAGIGAVVSVGASKLCVARDGVGADAGLVGFFDQAGNAGEWINACSIDGKFCNVSGGDFTTGGNDGASCTFNEQPLKTTKNERIGIRCCGGAPG